MKNQINLLTVVLVFGISAVGNGQEASGGFAGPFLQYSVTPRASGMGNAYTAVSDDISAVFFNPGAVAQLQKLTIGGAYRDLSLQRSLQQLAVSFPVRSEAVIALSAEMASMGDIMGRNSRGEPTGNLDNIDAMFGVTFSRRFSKYFTAGGDVRYYYKKLVNTKANSAGFDFGSMIHLTRKGGLPRDGKIDLVRFAFVVRNIGAKYPWNTGDYWSKEGLLGTSVTESVPLAVKVGTSVLFLNSKLLLAVDGEKDEHKKLTGYAGVEYKLVEEVALRAGLSQGKPTFGAGFKVPMQKVDARIDIAVQQALNIGGWESIFGLSVGI
jgi:hypothetical protein